MEDTDDLAQALRARRETLGSVAAVADELGVEALVVSQWLVRPPRSQLARALARKLSA